MALGQPAWSRVDEPAHYDVIAQYAAGIYPYDSVTTIRPETLDVMERTGVYGFVVDNTYALPDVSAGFQPMPSGLSDAAHVLWIRRHGYQYSYEAFQPPLYYAAALPAWLAGDALGGAIGALYAVRIFDALLAALLAPLSLLIALHLWPGNRAVGWGAALVTAVMPGVALNLTSVTNDVLVSVLGAACILVAVGGSWSRRRIVLLGLLFGAALLTKTTAAGLAPALAVALLQHRRAGGLRPLLAAGAIAATLVAPWIVANVAIYGEPITATEQLAMSAFPARTTSIDFWSVSTLHSFVTFWTGDPFLSLPLAVPLALLAAFMVALSAAGLWHTRRSGWEPLQRSVVIVVGLAAIGAGLVSVTSPALAAFNAPGRLAYVGVCAVATLLVAGLWLELPSPRLRRGVVGLFATLSLAGLATVLVPPSPAPSDPGHPLIARAQPLHAVGTFDGLTADVETCVVDTSGSTWLGVSLVNSGDMPVEWSQNVEVDSSGGTVATSDYRRSTQLPVALQPGLSYSGWLWVGPSSRLRGLTDPSIRLRSVAADGYRTIGDLVIRTTLC
jgi:Dolichyl-phosphate-mannose-protein mannosyltransferase